MGIPGLLPLLKSIMLPMHIKDLKGCTVAIDTYSWLHKGALCCSKELCKGIPTSKHIDYCMHRVNMLRHYGVKPILVFDGGLLPMKSEQENKRARSRKENLSRAVEHESNGNTAAAYECYQKAVDISPSVAYDLIQVLRQDNISYVVAPYEADAQMTYLAVSKQVDAVITEDSDLIAFGCTRIIYKMDKFGQGVEFHAPMLQQNRELPFTGFTKQMVLEMCILSGCDYLPSLTGMGLKKAHALIKKFKSFDKVLKHLKYSSVAVSPLYEESFKKAILTFQHQRVYDPVTEEIVHLFELPDNLDGNLEFLGPPISQDVAKAIAKGDLDPLTKVPFEGERDGAESADIESYQLKNFKPECVKKKLELPAQKNLLTNYFCFASLEAKRKYKAPRLSPKIQITENGILNTMSSTCLQSNSDGKINSTSAATELVVSRAASMAEVLESQTNVNIGGEKVKDSEDRGTQYNVLQDFIYKPCMSFNKKHTSDPSQRKMGQESTNIVLRSAYFLQKATNELNEVQEDTFATDADIASARYATRRSSVDSERKINTTNRKVVASARYATRRSSVDSERKINTTNRKVVVSSYFQHKTVQGKVQYGNNEIKLVEEFVPPHDNNLSGLNEAKSMSTSDKENAKERNQCCQGTTPDNQEKFDVEDDITTNLDKYAMPSFSRSNGCLEGARKRRKVASTDNPEAEDSRGNKILTGDYTSNISDTPCEIQGEDQKFGCNISHIGHYSEIAEKSIEKFVSVISSFKFTSNGSRASGLRAPLKDVKNTCSNRPSSNMDLSKFAYAPKKESSTSRRV